MALPTAANLVTLDFAFRGGPFCYVGAKSGIDTTLIDLAFQAQPFAYAPAVSSSPDITLALSGQASTASAGTLGVSRTNALSGQAATGSAGTLGVGLSAALAGSAATGSAGSIVYSASLALTGQAATADAGTVTAEGVGGDTPRVVSDGTFIWNWLYGKKRRVAEELDEEVAEAAQAVLEEAKAQDDAALALALDNLESALAEAVKRNKALVERAMYAQLIRSIEDQIERLRTLQIQRLEAHLAERAAYRAMVDAEAVELLSILELIE